MARRNGTKMREEDRAGAMAPYSRPSGFMTQMRDEFDRLFERFTHNWPESGMMRGELPWRNDLEVQENEKAVTVRAELPGFDTKDIDVQVTDNRLVIRASHKSDDKDDKTSAHRWSQREFYQAVSLPSGIDTAQIDARYRNGLLMMTLPKSEQRQGTQVKVRDD